MKLLFLLLIVTLNYLNTVIYMQSKLSNRKIITQLKHCKY